MSEENVRVVNDNDLEDSVAFLCRFSGGVFRDGVCVLEGREYRLPEVLWREFNVVLSADVILSESISSDEVVRKTGARWVYNITMSTYVVEGQYWKAYIYCVNDEMKTFPVRVQANSTFHAYRGLIMIMRRIGAVACHIRSVARILRVRVCGVSLGEIVPILYSLEPDFVYDGDLVALDERGHFRFRARVWTYPYIVDGLPSTRGCVLFSIMTKCLKDVFLLLEALKKVQGGDVRWEEAPLR